MFGRWKAIYYVSSIISYNQFLNKYIRVGCTPAIDLILKLKFYSFQSGNDKFLSYNLKYLSQRQITITKLCFSKMSGINCWSCHKLLELRKFNCAFCGALQYPKPNINYFELFEISQTYDIDLEDLSLKFRNMQMSFHPDKFSSKSKVI